MIKRIIMSMGKGLILSSLICFMLIIWAAYFYGGSVMVDINHFNEGKFELILFTMLFPVSCYIIYEWMGDHNAKRQTKKRKK